MELIVELKDINFQNNYQVYYKIGDTPGPSTHVNGFILLNGVYTPQTNLLNVNVLNIDSNPYGKQFWFKIVDIVTSDYIIKNILIHDKIFYDTLCEVTPSPTPTTTSEPILVTPSPTPTPTSEPILVTPSPTPTSDPIIEVTPTPTPTSTPDPELFTIYRSGFAALCEEFCQNKFNFTIQTTATSGYSDIGPGDIINGIISSGFYAIGSDPGNTDDDPFKVVETDANGEILGVYVCVSGECIPL